MSDLGVSAAKAYLQTAQTLAKAPGLDEMGGSQGPAFGDFLNTAISSVSKAGVTAETAITNASMGNADLVDVVTAVAAAEATLETVIAVRDEVIKAYQDIMRMPI
jgi:flagellar hook-basal body complex protein FliE